MNLCLATMDDIIDAMGDHIGLPRADQPAMEAELVGALRCGRVGEQNGGEGGGERVWHDGSSLDCAAAIREDASEQLEMTWQKLRFWPPQPMC